jgi:Protein of unknown function (DUF3684)
MASYVGRRSKYLHIMLIVSDFSQAVFLFSLGLRQRPPLEDIINISASADEHVRSAALQYFLDNFASWSDEYNPQDFSNVSYILALKNDLPCMGTPQEVCRNWSH